MKWSIFLLPKASLLQATFLSFLVQVFKVLQTTACCERQRLLQAKNLEVSFTDSPHEVDNDLREKKIQEQNKRLKER